MRELQREMTGLTCEMKTQIGTLYFGNHFKFDGKIYRVGRLINGTNGYVACVDIRTHKVIRLHIDTMVEV